jgi:hypothetical protein
MTNYERICADKAFCASILADGMDSLWYEKFLEWLDQEQRELTDEREHKNDADFWPDWKKRAALSNYEFGKEDA